MSTTYLILLLTASALSGSVLGYFIRWLVGLSKKGSVEIVIKQMLVDARQEAQRITEDATKQIQERLAKAEEERERQAEELRKLEDRLIKKDELLDRRQTDIDREHERNKETEAQVEKAKKEAEQLLVSRQALVEKASGMSREQAKEELFRELTKNHEEDLVVRMQKLEREGKEKLEIKARDILSTVVQRLATSTASESMTTSVPIASEEVKGKIIGKEGRNIRSFERAAGVELVIDDTPGIIIISAFDPVRRHVAKLALEQLIADGRIQPAKIEEAVQDAKEKIGTIIKEKGEQAAYETGVFNLDPRIIAILGRLHFRTSYGQNVLQHSIEMAHISGMLAEELGGDASVARAGALLHDIGKAIDHEVAGTHVDIGRQILQKFGVDERIMFAMQSHHEEYPYATLESIIVQTADALSGGRPGARRDSIENYLKRLRDLEEIANSFPGVEKSYAIQAGREIRVFVNPKEVNDIEARTIARQIAVRIEQELKYPGEIKVLVIREERVLEVAR